MLTSSPVESHTRTPQGAPLPQILVIEDDPNIARTLVELLGHHGFEASRTDSGEAGLERLAQERFDLVLLDVRLPGMNGFETCARIRESHGASLPVIMLTAFGDPGSVRRGYEAGADDFLQKPPDTPVPDPQGPRLPAPEVASRRDPAEPRGGPGAGAGPGPPARDRPGLVAHRQARRVLPHGHPAAGRPHRRPDLRDRPLRPPDRDHRPRPPGPRVPRRSGARAPLPGEAGLAEPLELPDRPPLRLQRRACGLPAPARSARARRPRSRSCSCPSSPRPTSSACWWPATSPGASPRTTSRSCRSSRARPRPSCAAARSSSASAVTRPASSGSPPWSARWGPSPDAAVSWTSWSRGSRRTSPSSGSPSMPPTRVGGFRLECEAGPERSADAPLDGDAAPLRGPWRHPAAGLGRGPGLGARGSGARGRCVARSARRPASPRRTVRRGRDPPPVHPGRPARPGPAARGEPHRHRADGPADGDSLRPRARDRGPPRPAGPVRERGRGGGPPHPGRPHLGLPPRRPPGDSAPLRFLEPRPRRRALGRARSPPGRGHHRPGGTRPGGSGRQRGGRGRGPGVRGGRPSALRAPHLLRPPEPVSHPLRGLERHPGGGRGRASRRTTSSTSPASPASSPSPWPTRSPSRPSASAPSSSLS